MPRLFYPSFLTLLLCFVSASAAPEEEWKQKLQNAEAQLTATYAQVEAQLDADQKSKLETAQVAWDKYRKLTADSFAKYSWHYDRDEEAEGLLAAAVVWSRVSHLNRMLEHRDLKGSDSDFRDADAEINRLYKALRDSRDYREQRDALKELQLSWIAYRDASVDSESLACPNPASASVRIKTELTYERIALLHGWGFKLSRRLSGAPPDLEKEMHITMLLIENPKIRQGAADYFCAHAEESLPLLIEQLKIGMLYSRGVPVFEKLGATAIPPLLELLDKPAPERRGLSDSLAATGPTIIPELIARIPSPNILTSLASLNALEILGPKAQDALPAILEIIREPRRKTSDWTRKRYSAIRAALSIAPKDPEVAKAIVDSFLASPTDDRNELEALGRLGHAAKDTLPFLIQQARAQEPLSDASYPLISIISPEDIELMPSLIEGLVDPKNVYWSTLGFALARLGDPASAQLVPLLQGSNDEVARRAATTLSRLKEPSDEVVLAVAAMTDREDVFEAIFYIDLIAEFKESAKTAIPTLIGLYKSNRKGVSAAALHALRAIAPDSEEIKNLGLPEPFVSDPFYDAGCYAESELFEQVPRLVMDEDFNNDGTRDIGISISMGKHGARWQLYLKVAEREYKRVDELDTVSGMDLLVKEKGVGYLKTYLTTSAATGVEALYSVSMDGLRLVKSVDLEWIDGEARPVEANEQLPALEGYTKIELKSHPIEKEVLLDKKPETKITPSNN